MSDPFNPHESEATDYDILTMPSCEHCGIAIPWFREPFCRSCFLKRRDGICAKRGCASVLGPEEVDVCEICRDAVVLA